MNKPDIKTALPLRRYQYGEFTVTLLGEIKSGDANQYRYIAAVMLGSEPEPGLYLTAERNHSADGEGRYAMRLIMKDGAKTLGFSDAWSGEEAFAGSMLDVISQVLKLADEEPFRLT